MSKIRVILHDGFNTKLYVMKRDGNRFCCPSSGNWLDTKDFYYHSSIVPRYGARYSYCGKKLIVASLF